MNCPKCGRDQIDGALECSRCGIVFAKYRVREETVSPTVSTTDRAVSRQSDRADGSFLKGLLFYLNPEIDMLHVIGRGVVFIALFVWGLTFIFSSIESNYSGTSFMHIINLPFHEAGHILFRVLGQFMMTAGGSLMQLLIPLICMTTFLVKTKDPFAASTGLWWLGESLIDLAPYINDARDLKLILLGGVTGQDVDDYHDWEYILRNLGLLQYDHTLAGIAHAIGAVFIICALIWGGSMLFRQVSIVRSRNV